MNGRGIIENGLFWIGSVSSSQTKWLFVNTLNHSLRVCSKAENVARLRHAVPCLVQQRGGSTMFWSAIISCCLSFSFRNLCLVYVIGIPFPNTLLHSTPHPKYGAIFILQDDNISLHCVTVNEYYLRDANISYLDTMSQNLVCVFLSGWIISLYTSQLRGFEFDSRCKHIACNGSEFTLNCRFFP